MPRAGSEYLSRWCIYILRIGPGAWTAVTSVRGYLSTMIQSHTHRFKPFSEPPVEGLLHLELTWILTPFLKNSFGWVYKPRSSLCTHAFHRTDSNILTFTSYTDKCWPKRKQKQTKNKKQKHTHIQHAPSIKKEWDYLYGGLKSGHIHKNFTKIWWEQRDVAGKAEYD